MRGPISGPRCAEAIELHGRSGARRRAPADYLSEPALRALPGKELPFESPSSTPERPRDPPRALAAHASAWKTAVEMLPWLLWLSGFVTLLWIPLGMDAVPAGLACAAVTLLVAIPCAFLVRFEPDDGRATNHGKA